MLCAALLLYIVHIMRWKLKELRGLTNGHGHAYVPGKMYRARDLRWKDFLDGAVVALECMRMFLGE